MTDKEIILTSHRFATFELKTTLLVPHSWSRKPTSTPGRCKTICWKQWHWKFSEMSQLPSTVARSTPQWKMRLQIHQIVIRLWYASDGWIIVHAHEELIGLQHVDIIYAATIAITIKDVIQRMNARLKGARRQCYDGCSKMSAPKKCCHKH